MNPQTQAERQSAAAEDQDNKASFAETALKLGGKSDDEARRMGAVDKADDQVEELFAKRFQTIEQPRASGHLGPRVARRAIPKQAGTAPG